MEENEEEKEVFPGKPVFAAVGDIISTGHGGRGRGVACGKKGQVW